MVKKLVYILSFIELFSFGIVIPMLSMQFLALGGNRFMRGMLGSLQCLLQFLAGPIFGSWSDNIGAKSALLVSSYGLLIGQLIFAIPNIYCFIAGRIINACFLHGQILVKSLLAESKEADPASAQSKIRAVGAMSFTFAPILGGIIMSMNDGFFKLSMLCTAMSIVNVVVCHSLPPSPNKQQKAKDSKDTKTDKKSKSPVGKIFENLKQVDWKIFGALFTLRFLVEMAASIYHQGLGYVFAEVFKSTPKEVGVIVSFYGVCMIIVNIKMKAVRKRIANGYKWGTLGMLFAFGLIYMLPYFWTYIGFIVLFCTFKALLEATWTDSIIEMSDEKNNGAVNGAFQSLVQLSGFIAPLVNGYTLEVYGHSATILLCCCVALSAVATSYRLTQPKPKVA